VTPVLANQLYYITHINNLASILQHGILSHHNIEKDGIPYERIYDSGIVSNRQSILTPDSKSLWHYANLYFQPRNPMLYRVLYEKSYKDIAIVAVSGELAKRHDVFISLGNAAHSLSTIVPSSEYPKYAARMKKNVDVEWWTEENGSKRKIMSECLVPEAVGPENVQAIYVASHELANKLKDQLPTLIPIIPEPKFFFQPNQKIQVTNNLFIVDGDMFFSRMQTLTISVNCVGVMGKGLASRAKYQFPDVYVVYQDACRKKALQMGKPYLYQRETSFDYKLADEPESFQKGEGRWFLLFATKNHWKQNADRDGIEKGLIWLVENYKKEKITSIALPALGCGLGNLEWGEVGPLMCKYLSKMDIPTWVYLPSEKMVKDEQLTKNFLLGTS
jgi:O-acetyl-ADP-ribose deacetylase (regulator of RNase III)